MMRKRERRVFCNLQLREKFAELIWAFLTQLRVTRFFFTRRNARLCCSLYVTLELLALCKTRVTRFM